MATQPHAISETQTVESMSFCEHLCRGHQGSGPKRCRSGDQREKCRGFAVENGFPVNNEKCVVEDYKPSCSMET